MRGIVESAETIGVTLTTNDQPLNHFGIMEFLEHTAFEVARIYNMSQCKLEDQEWQQLANYCIRVMRGLLDKIDKQWIERNDDLKRLCKLVKEAQSSD